MKRILVAAATAVALFGTPVLAQTSSGTMTAAEMAKLTAKDFVAMAASSDMFEIQSSEAAQQMATNADVKEFAQHMVTDHSSTSEMLMATAKDEGITPPTSMTAKHAAMLTEISGMSGDAFDKAYVNAQVMAHEEAVALFTSYSQNGDNEKLRALAAKTLPVLQEHLEEAQALQSKVSS